jgi:anti-anti-sigma factor
VDEALLYREHESIIYIRAQGHITANVCADLKARVFDRLEAKPPINEIFIDLSECDYMDSTFMGLLVGFNKRFLRFSEKPVSIIRANETCKKLLRTIGVLRLVSVLDEAKPFPEPMENINTGRKAGASLILKAHEELIDISEENEARFGALRNVLKSSMEDEDEEDNSEN